MKFFFAVFALYCSVFAMPPPSAITPELGGNVVGRKSVAFAYPIQKVHEFKKSMPASSVGSHRLLELSQPPASREVTYLRDELISASDQLDRVLAKMKVASLDSYHDALVGDALSIVRTIDPVNPSVSQVQQFKNAIKALENSIAGDLNI